ncbi:MAG: metal transporter CNNM [Saprospiraceae bacterium]|jgi:metal transporter CNNM
MKLDNLLNHFLINKNHLACFFDQFATFTGVVSLEDVIEEIFKSRNH